MVLISEQYFSQFFCSFVCLLTLFYKLFACETPSQVVFFISSSRTSVVFLLKYHYYKKHQLFKTHDHFQRISKDFPNIAEDFENILYFPTTFSINSEFSFK